MNKSLHRAIETMRNIQAGTIVDHLDSPETVLFPANARIAILQPIKAAVSDKIVAQARSARVSATVQFFKVA